MWPSLAIAMHTCQDKQGSNIPDNSILIFSTENLNCACQCKTLEKVTSNGKNNLTQKMIH